jgi:hypothetical protein
VTVLTTRFALFTLLATCLCTLIACGGEKDKEGLTKACGITEPAMKAVPTLPGKFPTAQGMTYTGVKKSGPTTVATGYIKQTIGPAHDAYTNAVRAPRATASRRTSRTSPTRRSTSAVAATRGRSNSSRSASPAPR